MDQLERQERRPMVGSVFQQRNDRIVAQGPNRLGFASKTKRDIGAVRLLDISARMKNLDRRGASVGDSMGLVNP